MNYQKYADKAYEKIKKYGSPIVIKQKGDEKEYNPDTDEYEGVEVEIKGVAIQRSFDQKNVDGSNVKFGDILFMACLDGTPKSNDTVVYGGKEYTVLDVKVMNPNGEKQIFFNIQAR